MNTHDFSFSAHAADLDAHIGSSIPEYEQLVERCIRLSSRFVQSGTSVVDIGCSTGTLIKSIREANQPDRPRSATPR